MPTRSRPSALTLSRVDGVLARRRRAELERVPGAGNVIDLQRRVIDAKALVERRCQASAWYISGIERPICRLGASSYTETSFALV